MLMVYSVYADCSPIKQCCEVLGTENIGKIWRYTHSRHQERPSWLESIRYRFKDCIWRRQTLMRESGCRAAQNYEHYKIHSRQKIFIDTKYHLNGTMDAMDETYHSNTESGDYMLVYPEMFGTKCRTWRYKNATFYMGCRYGWEESRCCNPECGRTHLDKIHLI